MKKLLIPTVLLSLITLASCEKDDYDELPGQPLPQGTVVKASGTSAEIITQLDVFRALLGDSLNTVPGKTSGRREVNWDGVPANLTNNANFPLDFFNQTDAAAPNGRKRGLVYLDKGFAFRLDSSNFSEIDPSYAAQFIPFSPKKSIIALGTTVSEVVFKVPGTNTDAFINGFGIIFIDVDNANSTSLEFYSGNKSLGIFKAPARTANGPFSFLGVHFGDTKVTRVKIVAGNGVLVPGAKDVSDGGQFDLVAYDDFLYDEPTANN